MLFILSCLPFFLLFAWLASRVADALGVSTVYVWIAYYVASELVESRRLTHSPALRSSRLIGYLGRVVMRCGFSHAAAQRLAEVASENEQVLFPCEPHGIGCSPMVWGFAAHGGALPESLARRTLVVGHVVFKTIPIVRNLYAIFGVIDNCASTIQAALDDGYSLALVPSSILGKAKSLSIRYVDQPEENARLRVTIWRRSSIGCFVYAQRRRMSIVPVISPEEDYGYRLFFNDGRWFWVLATGWWFVRPYYKLEWRVGRTLSTASSNAASIAASVYSEYAEMVKGDYDLVVRHANDVVFGGGDQ